MNFVGSCEECQRLSALYEAITIEWFRVQGQLRVAEFSREQELSHNIVGELTKIAAHRQAIREEAEKHTLDVHPLVSVASKR
jgi:hypothetical protein